VMHISILNKH